MQLAIEEAIENLYRVFSRYTTSDMHYCHCGCIDEKDVKKLASKKLRDLEEDDFAAYHGSALYTWGDLSHYKHFLPRVLEVHNQKNGYGLVGLFELTYKLKYAEWLTWDTNEIKAIQDFILADFNDFVNHRSSDLWQTEFEYYAFFFPLEKLLDLWELEQGSVGLRNFVYFFYFNGVEIFNRGLEIENELSVKEFKKLIQEKDLQTVLEKEFFAVADTDDEYSNYISVVLLIIEQNM